MGRLEFPFSIHKIPSSRINICKIISIQKNRKRFGSSKNAAPRVGLEVNPGPQRTLLPMTIHFHTNASRMNGARHCFEFMEDSRHTLR
jgi:hypothetical protein